LQDQRNWPAKEVAERTLAMVDEFVHNNPQDAAKERFLRLEEQVVDISHNMAILMEAPTNKFRPFQEVGGSNSESWI
jgi:hypothetical protein